MRILLILLTLSLSGCVWPWENVKEVPEVATFDETAKAPKIDCKPYPKPDPVVIPDITPESIAEGWLFSHSDYRATSNLVNYIIKHQKQTRAIAKHFVDCENQFNEKIGALNSRI